MELSAEMFERTIRLIKGDGTTVKNQRRAHPRVGVCSHITIIPVEPSGVGQPVEVCTRDISRSGIGLISAQKMKIRSRFVVRFPRDNEKPLALLCTIKCCNQLSKGLYAIGAVFEGVDKVVSEAA
jgi:hypothetical protein